MCTAPTLCGNNQGSRKKYVPWQSQKSSPGQWRQVVVHSKRQWWLCWRMDVFAFCYEPVYIQRKVKLRQSMKEPADAWGQSMTYMCPCWFQAAITKYRWLGGRNNRIVVLILGWRREVWDEGVSWVDLVSAGFWWWAFGCSLAYRSSILVSTFMFSRQLPVPCLCANPSFFRGISGWWDSSADKSTCHQAWWAEFDP